MSINTAPKSAIISSNNVYSSGHVNFEQELAERRKQASLDWAEIETWDNLSDWHAKGLHSAADFYFVHQRFVFSNSDDFWDWAGRDFLALVEIERRERALLAIVGEDIQMKELIEEFPDVMRNVFDQIVHRGIFTIQSASDCRITVARDNVYKSKEQRFAEWNWLNNLWVTTFDKVDEMSRESRKSAA